ncbi:MAG TPA: hypothetical protein DD381_09435 [Lentisphaeria bacterium]|nr:MAG: hypothetical protein A2X47_11390 [Lentisphaerae bacterium GWF2_38_69]HBM16546.1 hypothetical protein [Lentisphaeria bacterium]
MDLNDKFFLAFKTIAELEELPLIALSSELKILFCNEPAIKRFSLNCDSLINRSVDEVFDGLKLCLELFSNAIKDQKPKKIPNVTALSSSTTTSEITLIPSEGILYILLRRGSSCQDSLSTQLINKKEMLGNLIACICNNFNNILGAINGNSSIIKSTCENISEKNTKEEIWGYLDLIDKSVVRATELVTQLSSFSAKINLSFKEVDLNDIIRNIYIGYLSKLGSEITVDAEILSTKAMVRVDSSLLQTAIRDICENSIHSMTIMRGEKDSSKGGTLSITVDHVETDKTYRILHPKAIRPSYWIVTVADTGVGIKKELIKKVINPFYTEGKSMLNPDGLGLSVANTTIQENGGFIEIESEVGAGTKVMIHIPEHKQQEDINKSFGMSDSWIIKKANSAILKGMAGSENMVLVVDDDIIMRRVAEVVLEKAGYKVLVASDGDEAVNIYKEKSKYIAGVFLDNSMPTMSGIEAFYEMKKINPEIKALLISGHDGDSDEVKTAINNGMKGFVKKPYTMIDLGKKAKELLG